MRFQAKNGTVDLNGAGMDYIRFGRGSRVLVMLPGLGEALQSVKGTALPMALMYRCFAKDFTVYMFSRREKLLRGCTTRDMARDLAEAMDRLGISRADIFGVSMGGMIAQHLALDHPEKVGKLVLVVTAARQDATMTAALGEWEDLAARGDHAGFMESNLRRIYSGDYYRKNRWMVPLLGLLTKPKSYDRFFIQAEACRTHDTWAELGRIRAETLVVGGGRDQVLNCDASREIAEKIPGARLKIYGEWGHGLYEEAPDFNGLVLDFLTQ